MATGSGLPAGLGSAPAQPAAFCDREVAAVKSSWWRGVGWGRRGVRVDGTLFVMRDFVQIGDDPAGPTEICPCINYLWRLVFLNGMGRFVLCVHIGRPW